MVAYYSRPDKDYIYNSFSWMTWGDASHLWIQCILQIQNVVLEGLLVWTLSRKLLCIEQLVCFLFFEVLSYRYVPLQRLFVATRKSTQDARKASCKQADDTIIVHTPTSYNSKYIVHSSCTRRPRYPSVSRTSKLMGTRISSQRLDLFCQPSHQCRCTRTIIHCIIAST